MNSTSNPEKKKTTLKNPQTETTKPSKFHISKSHKNLKDSAFTAKNLKQVWKVQTFIGSKYKKKKTKYPWLTFYLAFCILVLQSCSVSVRK